MVYTQAVAYSLTKKKALLVFFTTVHVQEPFLIHFYLESIFFLSTSAAFKQNNSSNLTATSRFPVMSFDLWIGKSGNSCKYFFFPKVKTKL